MSNATLSLKLGAAKPPVKPDPVMLQTLLDMGFDKDASEYALGEIRNASVEAAIDFLQKNPTPPPKPVVPEPQPAITPAVSTASNTLDPIEEYRRQQQAKHEEAQLSKPKKLAPEELTKPENLVLLSEIKLRGDSEANKLAFEEKQRQIDAKKRERERALKKEQLAKIRAQVKEDKENRTGKLPKTTTSSKPASTTAPVTTPSPSATTTSTTSEAQLQIRMADGSTVKTTLPALSTLAQVAKFIQAAASNDDDFTLVIPFPRKEYPSDVFATVTLLQAQLVPRGSLVVQPNKNKGVVKKGEGILNPPPLTTYPYPSIMPQQPQPPSYTDTSDTMDTVSDERSLLCQNKWLLSTEEIPDDHSIIVFRPETYAFPNSDASNRDGMTFTSEGNVTSFEATGNSSMGSYKLKQVDTSMLQLEVSVIGKPFKRFDIVSITDEVLILKLDE